MPVEIEAKMKVESLEPVRERLKLNGATRVGEYLETNTFFDTDDRSLLAADEGLRLRRARDQHTGHDEFTITFKGPRQHGPLKSREEIELAVANHDAAVTLLEALGFARVMSFEKKRERWTLDNCTIELDELPHLGTYVRFAKPSTSPTAPSSRPATSPSSARISRSKAITSGQWCSHATNPDFSRARNLWHRLRLAQSAQIMAMDR
jgi:predicted adenylyl cyclase CyaB